MISVQEVNKNYDSVVALQDINCQFRDGEITGLLGLNGAGKTTLMRAIYGLLPVDTGRILVDERSVAESPEIIRRQLGVLPDDAGLYKRLTARENIRYFARLHQMDSADTETRMEQLIGLLGMENIADRRAEGFSLGERMKTLLARAIVHQPQHILLDEPTNGLDVITTRAVRKLLFALRDEGRCVIFSSHLMHEVEQLCDRLIIIDKGRICVQGSVEEIRQLAACQNLEEAFIALTTVTENC